MPGEDVATLVASSTPYLSAALAAYGTAVLGKARDEAADATVGVGRRLLQRIFGHRQGDRAGEALPAALAGAAESPEDADVLGALRLAIRRELEADPAMLADIREILASGQGTTVHAPRIHSGRDTYYAGRDLAVNRPAEPTRWPLRGGQDDEA